VLSITTVIDCCTHRVVGWSMATHMRTALISDAIEMAATNVALTEGAIFHSDYAEVEVKPRNRELACA